jgi:histidinol-phosphate aminotransferase
MDVHLNRRQWLKTGAAAVAGWIVDSGSAAALTGHSFRPDFGSGNTIRLNNNESHFGISGAAREAIRDAVDDCSAYPDDHYHELKELIAARDNLRPENIILGAGSIEIITAALHVYRSRGGALTSDPTYFDFVDYAEKARCPLRQVALTNQYELDLEAMEKQAGSRTGLVYICNPQNPTGAMTPQERLRHFCLKASRKALIVLDEAYCDYVEDPAYSSMVDLVREGENILVTRTFSKIFGLAGLRIGYGMARPDVIRNLAQLERNFAPVTSLSLRAAIASYKDEEFVRKVRRQNQEVKSYVCQELRRLGYVFIPSYTNFIIFKVQQDSQELAKKLEDRSFLVRPFKFGGADWIRVSLGTPGEMRAFIANLEDLDGAEERANAGEKIEARQLADLMAEIPHS